MGGAILAVGLGARQNADDSSLQVDGTFCRACENFHEVWTRTRSFGWRVWTSGRRVLGLERRSRDAWLGLSFRRRRRRRAGPGRLHRRALATFLGASHPRPRPPYARERGGQDDE